MHSRLMVRMTAPILAISALLLTVGVVGAWYVQRLQRNVSGNLLWNVSSMRAAEELEMAVRDVRTQLDLFLIRGDRQELEEVPRLRRHTEAWLARAERLAVTRREKELITRARRGHAQFFALFQRIRRQPSADLAGQVRRMEEVLVSKILRPVHEYLDFNEDEVAGTAAENQSLSEWLVLGLLLLGTCGAGAGLLAGFGIARGIRRSIVRLSVPIRDAAGKLNEVVGPIPLSAGWNLNELQGVLSKMASEIGTVTRRLRQSQREVLRAEQLAAVGQLAAGMAHELRNPLMSMKILVQAAAERNDAGLGGRDLAVLEEEITRLEALIRTFLDFARPPQLDKRPFPVQSLVEQTLGLISARAWQQGVRIDGDFPDEPLIIEADMGQVRQVVLNLLLNALDALPRGGTVWVQASRGERQDGEDWPGPGTACATRKGEVPWLTLRVADDGPGLPAGLGEQIFEPFVSTKQTGVGLGLSICRRIIEAHGGVIRAANRPEGGAVFTVQLPCRGRRFAVRGPRTAG
jgi:signal transduction histidine kinase